MSENFDPVLTNLFLGSVIFAITGVAWQLMKLLSKTTETMEEFKKTNENINKLIDKTSHDYEYISATIRGVSSTIERVNAEVLQPIRSIGNSFKMIDGFVRGLFSRFRNEPEADDFLPYEY